MRVESRKGLNDMLAVARRDGGIDALLAALAARDGYTCEHSRSVVDLVELVARRLGASPEEVQLAKNVALLHDVGKIGVPDAVLSKPGPLTPDEWVLMREHPVIGARIVASIPGLEHLASAIRAEHERWDGKGYPDELKGKVIPFSSRVVFVCDAYHAMVSDRPYRAAIPESEARRELERGAGHQFDPLAVQALLAGLAGA